MRTAVQILVGFLLASTASAQQEEREWSFLVQPYGLFASIDGDASVGGIGGAVEVDFGDILENLELAGMLHLEAFHASGWGAIVDYGFMDLASERAGALGVVLDAEIRQAILEAFAVRRFDLDGGAVLDAFGGVRWWDIDLDTTVTPGPVARDREVDWVDVVLGARAEHPLAESWTLLSRADVGGFGLESDFTWSADLGVRWHASERFALELRYHALGVDFEEDEDTPRAFGYDTVTHGPVLAFSFFL